MTLTLLTYQSNEVAMSYKVFFVEDEIVTHDGIHDKVDWQGNGFE